jgi:putative flippase GtrA
VVREVLRIAGWYSVIALIATAANIGCQAISMAVYAGPYAIPLSVLVGTAAGLPIKYILEKNYVFGFRADSVKHEGKLFVVYTFFGAFTTMVFWGTEYAFHAAFGTDAMRYLGAAIGLSIGYVLRYQLDRRFVFVSAMKL